MAKLTPFLPTLTVAQTTRAEAWLPVLELRLNARYGDRITSPPTPKPNEPAFLSAAADAIMTKLQRPGLIDSQGVGPANVKYNARAGLLKWFLPEQLDELDAIVGVGNIRSVRTPAPDAVRFGNRMSYLDQIAEGDC